jgi:hypothetical protein
MRNHSMKITFQKKTVFLVQATELSYFSVEPIGKDKFESKELDWNSINESQTVLIWLLGRAKNTIYKDK